MEDAQGTAAVPAAGPASQAADAAGQSVGAAGDAATAVDPALDPALDPTLDPLAVADAPQGIAERAYELLQAGGPVVAILVVMSVVALAIIFVKLLQFRAMRVGHRRTARQALELYAAGRPEAALALAARSPSPTAQALAQALRGKRRGLAEAKVREEVVRYGSDVLASLRGWFRPLEVIASLAPLLGLFGTVLGMIEAFQQLEAAGNQVNPAILSGGIWVALLTTAVGLAVAIPVVVVLNWLERKVDRLAHEMDSVVTRVFTEDLSQDYQEAEPYEPARFRPAAAAAGE